MTSYVFTPADHKAKLNKAIRPWQKRDGKYILISEMDDGHLINSARRIVRLRWRLEFLNDLITELRSRSLNDEADSIMEEYRMDEALL